MSPEGRDRRRKNRHKGREERREKEKMISLIKDEAITRSHLIGRNDETVWSVYDNLRMEVQYAKTR